MGKDRLEKKQQRMGKVELDRDQSLKYSGSTELEGPKKARKRQR